MSVAIPDGRKWFYQWDTNQRLLLNYYPVGTQVHFSLCEDNNPDTLVLEAYSVNNQIVVDVPNVLLQTSGQLHVYVYPITDDEGHTEEHWKFEVRKRKKPSDYVYVETEVLTVKKAEAAAVRAEECATRAESAAKSAETQAITVTECVARAEAAAERAEAIGGAVDEILAEQESYIGGEAE